MMMLRHDGAWLCGYIIVAQLLEFSRDNFLTLQFQGSLLKPMLISAEFFLKQQCDQHISTSSGYCVCADVLQMCANSNKLFTTIRLHNVQLVSAIKLRWMSN